MDYTAIIIILVIGFGISFFRQHRNEWILNSKLRMYELAIRRRHRNEQEGKPYFLLKEVNKSLWSYERMVWCFWIKDIKDMFKDEEMKKYIYGEDGE